MTLNEKKQNKYDKGLTVLVCMIQSGFQNLFLVICTWKLNLRMINYLRKNFTNSWSNNIYIQSICYDGNYLQKVYYLLVIISYYLQEVLEECTSKSSN